MSKGHILGAVAALVLLGQTASADEKISLKILYAGDPGSERSKDFVSFLRQHFTEVAETNYEKVNADETKPFDVVVFDWSSIYPRDKDGKIKQPMTSLRSPKSPSLPRSFDRPAVLIGAAGGFLAGKQRLKTDWL
jgi:hypothetical protein